MESSCHSVGGEGIRRVSNRNGLEEEREGKEEKDENGRGSRKGGEGGEDEGP